MTKTINNLKPGVVPAPDNPPHIVCHDIVAALGGSLPYRSKPISPSYLGKLLAKFRQFGAYAREPFSRQAINGMAYPERYAKPDGSPQYPISAEFAWAFWSWRESEKSGKKIRVIGTDGLSIEEIVGDSSAAYFVGEDGPQKIVVVGKMPDGGVVSFADGVSVVLTTGLQVRQCEGCEVKFLGWGRKRFHNKACAQRARRKKALHFS